MIEELLNAYDLSRRIDHTTLAQMRYAARSFAQFSQTFTSESVNAWIRHLERTGKSPSTVRTYRGAVLTLWNFAIERRMTLDKPEGIRSVKVPQKNATAFSRDECRQLLDAAGRLEGQFSCPGLPDNLRTEAIPSDLLGLVLRTRSSFGTGGIISVELHRSGRRDGSDRTNPDAAGTACHRLQGLRKTLRRQPDTIPPVGIPCQGSRTGYRAVRRRTGEARGLAREAFEKIISTVLTMLHDSVVLGHVRHTAAA